jgi:hypothetical protein
MLLKGQKVVIPTDTRPMMINAVHVSSMGEFSPANEFGLLWENKN